MMSSLDPILTESIEQAKNIGLIGRSGSGKSTLVRSIIRQYGTACAHIPQNIDASLNPRMKISSIIGTSDRALELCRIAEVDQEYISRRVGQLSGGQRARIAVIRALLCDPRIIIADESLGSLDPHTAHVVGDMLAQVEAGLVLVTHNLENIKHWCDMWICMGTDEQGKPGHIVEYGAAEDLWDLSYATDARKELVIAHNILGSCCHEY